MELWRSRQDFACSESHKKTDASHRSRIVQSYSPVGTRGTSLPSNTLSPKTASRSVHAIFAGLTVVTHTHTHTQSTLRATFVLTARIYAPSACDDDKL